MKNDQLKITVGLMIAFCGTQAYSASPQILLDPHLTSPSSLQSYPGLLRELGQKFTLLTDTSGKFESDHSFVHLYRSTTNPKGTRVVNRNVTVLLPTQLNGDQFMETLFRIRAARTLGASRIQVYSPIPISKIQMESLPNVAAPSKLDLQNLIAVAGADTLQEVSQSISLTPLTPAKSPVTQTDYWIGSSNYPALLAEISGLLGKSPITLSEMKSQPQLLAGRKIYWIYATTPPINSSFFQALSEIQWMQNQGANVHLISPYLPYARSDKPDLDAGGTTQGRLIADLIEAVGTQGITVVRAHAPQSLGFFKVYAQEISGRPTLVNYLKEQNVECVISPDAGFQKDATRYQHDLMQAYGNEKDVCLAIMNKERNFEGKEKILGGTGIEKIQGKQIVIIDDETSSGGTLEQVSRILQQYKPKSIFAVVTHLAGPAQKSLNAEGIDKLIVTNTLPVSTHHPKLQVLSIASEIASDIQSSENNR